MLAATRPDLDVLAVELSSFQLHHTHSMSAQAAAVLNVAADHLDWHGSFEAYAAAKGRIFERTQVACVYNAADPLTEELVRDGGRRRRRASRSASRSARRRSGQVGLVEDVLVDRGFARAAAHATPAELGTLADLAHLGGGEAADPGPGLPSHVVADALAAAALALAHGVAPAAVRDGLRAYRPGAHRIQTVAVVDGVAYVDDSKATNAHAAAASLAAFPTGRRRLGRRRPGQGRDRSTSSSGARRDRLRAVVLIGVDAEPLAGALSPDTRPRFPSSSSIPATLGR